MSVAASLNVLLTAQTAAFQTAMKGAEARVDSFAKRFDAAKNIVAGFAASAVVGRTLSTYTAVLNKFDDTADAAERLGVKFQELKAIQDASTSNGLDFAVITESLERFSVVLGKASQGSEQAKKLFSNLGLGSLTTGNADTAEAFFATLDGLRNITNNSERAAAAAQIFGNRQREVLNLLNSSQETYDKITKSMRDTSGQATDAMVDSLVRQKQYVEDLAKSWENLKTSMIATVGMALEGRFNNGRDAGLNGGNPSSMVDLNAPGWARDRQLFDPEGSARSQAAQATIAGIFAKIKATTDNIAEIGRGQMVQDANRRGVFGANQFKVAQSYINTASQALVDLLTKGRAPGGMLADILNNAKAQAAAMGPIKGQQLAPAASTLSLGSHASQMFDFQKRQQSQMKPEVKLEQQQVQLLQRAVDKLDRLIAEAKNQQVFGIF